MFGFLALGFFAVFAFGLIGGSGKDGKGGFLSTLIDNFKKLNDDEGESDEKDVKELRALLKKKPEDLSEREKKRIKELQKKVDRSYLNDSELEKLDKITGTSSEDDDDDDDKNTGEEDTEKDDELEFNKALAVLQSEVESKESDTSDDANDLREAYDAMIKCVFDGDGNKRKDEDIKSEFDKLDKTLKEKIEKHVEKASSDDKAIEEFKEKQSKVTPEQATAALEKAKAKRAEIAKKEEVDALEDARKKELEGKTDDEKKSINEKYDKQIEAANTKWDAKIKEHMDAAAKADKSESLRQMEKSAKEAEAKKKELEDKKKELDKPEAIENEIKACGDIKWEESSVSAGDLSGDDKEKKKAAEEFLQSKGVDTEMYKKYADVKSTLKEGEKIEENEDLKKAAEEVIKKKKEEIDKQIKDQDKIINDYNSAKDEVNNANEPKEPTKSTTSTINAIKNFKKQENDKEFYPVIDDDGDPTGDFAVAQVKSKDDDGNEKIKYVLRDKSGDETEINEDEFNSHKEKFNSFKEELNPEDEEKLEDALDKSYNETDDEKNSEEGKKAERDDSGKRVNPAKIWHKKKNKATGKTTKNYYNKNGDSISPQEYHDRIENYKAYVQKHKKTAQENFNISNFLKDKLVVERFYPRDITNYLHEHLK